MDLTVQLGQAIDAFQLLMSASTERSHLPSPIKPCEHRQLIATEQLHNEVVDYMKSTGAGFTCVGFVWICRSFVQECFLRLGKFLSCILKLLSYLIWPPFFFGRSLHFQASKIRAIRN